MITQAFTLYLWFVIPLGKLDTVQADDVTDSRGTRAFQSILRTGSGKHAGDSRLHLP
jgi:hypothetical protein